MRKNLFNIVFSLAVLAVLFGVLWERKQRSEEAFSVDAVTESEIKDELIVAVFMESIRGFVNQFYAEFYTGQIAVYDYETDILEIEKSNGLISVKFGVTPQVGAHNPLGYDELQYTIDSSGNRKLTDYKHVETYTVPERFEEYFIKLIEE